MTSCAVQNSSSWPVFASCGHPHHPSRDADEIQPTVGSGGCVPKDTYSSSESPVRLFSYCGTETFPRWLKPDLLNSLDGVAEATPFQSMANLFQNTDTWTRAASCGRLLRERCSPLGGGVRFLVLWSGYGRAGDRAGRGCHRSGRFRGRLPRGWRNPRWT